MANLCQVLWTVVVTITVVVGRIPALEDDNFSFDLTENDQFPSTNFVLTKMKISDRIYDHLLDHLGDELSAENVDLTINDYFPKDVESDEEDELDFVHEHDFDEDEDDDNVDDFTINLPNDASVSTDFGKRECKFAKVLAISKNGTKTFIKVRQSIKMGGNATTSATGNFNTSLVVTTSATGNFDVNITYSSKGQQQKVFASGAVVASSSSNSKIEKRRLFQQASADSAISLKVPAVAHVSSTVRSGSETFKLPFRSFLTLFKAQVNTTTDNVLKMKAIVEGEVVSRVAFANKTVSLTKSCIKAYVKSKSVANNTDVHISRFEKQFYDSVAHNQEHADDEDNNRNASSNLFEISLIRGKIHTWTKVVSQSKTELVIDVITCTKARTYGKLVKRGAFAIFTGSGQVAWEKSRVTIDAKRLHNLSPHEYGVHFIKKQLESVSLIQFLGNPIKMGM